MLHRRFPFAVLAVLALLACSGCGGGPGTADRHAGAPLYDIVVENRAQRAVIGRVQFGDYLTVAGGFLKPGAWDEHEALSGGIPQEASIELSVYRSDETDFDHGPTTKRTSRVPVKSQLPKGFSDGAFYFIIQQDLSLRLVVLSDEQWQAMKAKHERPE